MNHGIDIIPREDPVYNYSVFSVSLWSIAAEVLRIWPRDSNPEKPDWDFCSKWIRMGLKTGASNGLAELDSVYTDSSLNDVFREDHIQNAQGYSALPRMEIQFTHADADQPIKITEVVALFSGDTGEYPCEAIGHWTPLWGVKLTQNPTDPEKTDTNWFAYLEKRRGSTSTSLASEIFAALDHSESEEMISIEANKRIHIKIDHTVKNWEADLRRLFLLWVTTDEDMQREKQNTVQKKQEEKKRAEEERRPTAEEKKRAEEERRPTAEEKKQKKRYNLMKKALKEEMPLIPTLIDQLNRDCLVFLKADENKLLLEPLAIKLSKLTEAEGLEVSTLTQLVNEAREEAAKESMQASAVSHSGKSLSKLWAVADPDSPANTMHTLFLDRIKGDLHCKHMKKIFVEMSEKKTDPVQKVRFRNYAKKRIKTDLKEFRQIFKDYQSEIMALLTKPTTIGTEKAILQGHLSVLEELIAMYPAEPQIQMNRVR